MVTRKLRTFTPHDDQAGGKVTYSREDGYIAWLDGVCLGSVGDVDEGILVIAERRLRLHRQAA